MPTSTFTWSSYSAPTLACGVAVQPAPGVPSLQLDTFAFPATLHTTGATSIAVPITIAAGHSNLALVVVFLTDDTVNGVVTSITGAGATWQSVAFGATNNGSSVRCEVWYGTAPSTGAQTVTINFGALGANHDVTAGVYSYFDTDQTTPLANYITRTTAGDLIVTGPGGAGTISGRSAFSGATIAGCTSTVDANLGFNAAQEAAHCSIAPAVVGDAYITSSFPRTRSVIRRRA